MRISYENAVELTKIILEFFGLKTGLFSSVTSAVGLARGIAAENKLTDKQKFISELTNGIHNALQSDGVTDDVYEKLKITIREHLDLQELMNNYGQHDAFCRFLEDSVYTEWEQQYDPTFPAYQTALKSIVEAIYKHLELFDVGSHADIAVLEKLCSIEEMDKLYRENNFLLRYKGSLAECIDNASLPPIVEENRFHYLNPAIRFHGRKEELDAIETFLKAERSEQPNIHIWSITGPGGIGKSKLARHVAEKHRYDMGVVWLKKNDFSQILGIHDSKRDIPYDKPILFICDYANLWEKKIVELIEYMAKTSCTVYFLLLERTEYWYHRFLDANTYAYQYAYRNESTIIPPLNLLQKALDDAASGCVLDDFTKKYYPDALTAEQKLEPEKKEKIIAHTKKLGGSNQCLFLLLTADAYLCSGTFENWSKADLLRNYINRLKTAIHNSYSEDLEINGYRLLALATALDGLDLSKRYAIQIQETIDDMSKQLYRSTEKKKEFLSRLCDRNITELKIAPLKPDIVGEFLFIHEFIDLSDSEERSQWLDLIFSSDYSGTFLSRCLTDWYNCDELPELIAYMAEKDAPKTAKLLRDTILEIYAQEPAQKLLDFMEQIYENHKCAEIAAPYSRAFAHVSKFVEQKQKDKLLERMLSIAKELDKEESEDTAIVYHNIGFVYWEKGDLDKALEFYNKALKIWENGPGKEHPNTAASYNNIGSVYDDKGDLDKAVGFYNKALEINEKVLGKEHPDTAISYNNIGSVYDDKGDLDKALEFYNKALKIREKVLGTENLHTASSYNNIGLVYYKMGDLEKALEFYNKALVICEKVLGKEHPDTATSYNNIGSVYDIMGEFDKALEFYNKALKIREKVLGKEHPSTATSYNNIGSVYYEKGDLEKALEFYNKALEIHEKVLGTEHPDTAASYHNIGALYFKKEDYETALGYFSKAWDIFKEKLGENHPYTQNSIEWIEETKRRMNES
ncbi:MAG: DUF2225 domain-containing protein [Ruminococcus sp.]